MCIYLTKLNDVFRLKHNESNNGVEYKIRIDHSTKTGLWAFVKALQGNLYYYHMGTINKYKQ